MKNYVYYMHADARSPVSETMTMEEWFLEYKWMVDGEVFVPAPIDETTARIVQGDRLWFALYEKVVGCALVLRKEPSMLANQQEIWYNGATCARVGENALYAPSTYSQPTYCVRETTEEAAVFWLGQ